MIPPPHHSSSSSSSSSKLILWLQDYYDIIKTPMDLGTIKNKLDTGAYTNPWEYCDDVWLMFDNAWLYNKKNSRVYKWCSKVGETIPASVSY